MPSPVRSPTSPRMSASTLFLSAPSAIRRPISCVRRATDLDVEPLVRAPPREAPPDRVRLLVEVAHEGLVHDRDLRGRRPVALVELAAGHEPRPEGPEETGADLVDVRIEVLLLAGLVS